MPIAKLFKLFLAFAIIVFAFNLITFHFYQAHEAHVARRAGKRSASRL
jgi:Mg2+ and Co2+ transporter CorA